MGIGALNGVRGVFLDRDGVLNEAVMREGKPYPPGSAAEVKIIADAAAALARLKARGLPLIVVTNQPDVARGAQTVEEVEAIHERIRSELPVDDVLSCLHDDGDGCTCRKPKPGLILEGAIPYRHPAQFYDWGSLARHGCGKECRLPDGVDRSRLS